jgi:hypothetical protein
MYLFSGTHTHTYLNTDFAICINSSVLSTSKTKTKIKEATYLLEKQLLDINMEKSNLSSELDRLNEKGSRTIKDRQRLNDVSHRLADIERESVVLRTRIKQAASV